MQLTNEIFFGSSRQETFVASKRAKTHKFFLELLHALLPELTIDASLGLLSPQ
jgi:hypothetical protein